MRFWINASNLIFKICIINCRQQFHTLHTQYHTIVVLMYECFPRVCPVLEPDSPRGLVVWGSAWSDSVARKLVSKDENSSTHCSTTTRRSRSRISHLCSDYWLMKLRSTHSAWCTLRSEQYWIVITVSVNCQLIIDTVPRMNNKNILMLKISLSTVYTDSLC